MDASIPAPHQRLSEHIFRVRADCRLVDTQCVILLEHNSSTQAAIVADHVNMNSASFPRCVFLTFGRAKLAQGGTTRIPGIRTTTATKASMTQYLRLAINPMPLADSSLKLYFKADLKKQFCQYRRLPGQRDADVQNVFDAFLSELARFKKKTEMKNGTLFVTFTGKPEKDDIVIAVGMAFLVAYALVARDSSILHGGSPQFLSWGEICECIRPDDLNKPEYINQVSF